MGAPRTEALDGNLFRCSLGWLLQKHRSSHGETCQVTDAQGLSGKTCTSLLQLAKSAGPEWMAPLMSGILSRLLSDLDENEVTGVLLLACCHCR